MNVPPPHAQLLDLQRTVLHEINQLNETRKGIIEMEVDVRVPKLTMPSHYYKQDICELVHTHRVSKVLIYFSPKYALNATGKKELYSDLHNACIAGGDRIALWGKGKGKQVLDIRCQCVAVYRGPKVDKGTEALVARDDYRIESYTNNRKNQRHGHKGRTSSHQTGIDQRNFKEEDKCPFILSVFMDATGYFMKSTAGCVLHQFHARHDHLRVSTTHLREDKLQLQEDMNSARAKIGTAANVHYVRSARQGTPTLLSPQQIQHLCKKNESSSKLWNCQWRCDR
jgi:hypothetical protein